MKTIKGTLVNLAGIFAALTVWPTFSTAQSTLQFTRASALEDGRVQLTWQSESNAVYRIDYATELVDASFGGPAWRTLYEDIPSLGTNSYWADSGNLSAAPIVSHPRNVPMRFYRVVQTGTNNPAAAPEITVLWPTNGATISGDAMITVSISSSLDIDALRFFVDGAEVGFASDSETNFTLNTCQFPNGAHKVFAVVGNSSGAESTDDANENDVVQNLGISQTLSLVFNNLITDYAGLLRFNDTALGETNVFTAKFAACADWILSITNDSGAAVRTVTGTGYRMSFAWDGTDDSSLPVAWGAYGAVLSAALSSSPAPAPSQTINPAISEALAAGATTYFLKPPPMPPVRVRDNSGKIRFVPWKEIYGAKPLVELPIPSNLLKNTLQAESSKVAFSEPANGPTDGPQMAPPASQTTLLQPLPSVWFGSVGTMGIAYQGNHPDDWWPQSKAPDDGLSGRVRLNTGSPAGAYKKLKTVHLIAAGFNRHLSTDGYRLKFFKENFDVIAADLRGAGYGGNAIFDSVNIGFLVGHGAYGLEPDYTISFDGPLQSYFPVYTGAVGYDWVRLSEFDFGNASINSNLRWMSILSCNNLVDSVFQDCYDKEALPVGENLHLLCGAKTPIFMVFNFGLRYSGALTGHSTTRRTVAESWFYAGTQTQGKQPGGAHMSVVFRVIGWPDCFSDDLVNYQSPNSGNPADIEKEDRTVFNYP